MHPSIIPLLENEGFVVDYQPFISKNEVFEIIGNYHGLILRSKIFIGNEILERANLLKFIARAGAGMDQIVEEEVKKRNIILLNAPEGNRNAVAEHVLGLILNLFNKINTADQEIRNGIWKREENRGHEVDGKTIAIIGYGNNGKAFAKKLKGFDVNVLAVDILPESEVINENATYSNWQDVFENADIVSFHLPLTEITENLVNEEFISKFRKQIWLFNSSRGKVVVLQDLVNSLKSGKVLGAGLDVLPIENLVKFQQLSPELFQELMSFKNVVLTPHVAGWTFESYEKINQVLVEKIKQISF